MAKKVYIAGTAQHCGKTTTSIALMHLASRHYGRVGFIKPIGPKVTEYNGITVDVDALLIARLFGLEEDLALMSPVPFYRGFTRDLTEGRVNPAPLREAMVRACAEMERKYDFIVIEGAGHGGVGSVMELNNAQVARLFDAPVIIVSEGGIGSAIDAVQLNYALYKLEGAALRMIMMNKLIPQKREMALECLKKAFVPRGISVCGCFDYSPTLANPTISHIATLLDLPLQGDTEANDRIISTIQLGAASSQRVVDGLKDSTLMILTSSRDELIVTLSSLYHIPEYRRKIAGMVIAGGVAVSAVTQRILDDSGLPYIRAHRTTADIFSTLRDDVAKITADDREKIDWITTNAEKTIDFGCIDRLL